MLKACHHDARKRYQTAGEMHEDLLLLQAGRSVRRSRAMEARLAMLSKVAAVFVVLSTLAVAAYFYQQTLTREARELARQNQRQVAQLHEMNGVRLMEEAWSPRFGIRKPGRTSFRRCPPAHHWRGSGTACG